MKRIMLLLKAIPILVLFAVCGVSAQSFSDYIVNESIETYTPINTTALTPPGADADQYGNDWGCTNVNEIGFTFNFDNRTFTTWSADVNGHMKIGGAVTQMHGLNPAWNTTGIFDHLAPYTVDGACTSISTELQGTAPNRVRIIQWNGFCYWTANHGTEQMQVKLYENGTIKFCYGPGFSTLANMTAGSIYICGENINKFKGIIPGASNFTIETTAANWDGVPNTYLTAGKTYTFTGYPQVSNVFPPAGSILALGSVYSGTNDLKPGFSLSNQTGTFSPEIAYKIVGPLGTAVQRTVYQALGSADQNDLDVPVIGPLTAPMRFLFAKGDAAGANGDLDLTNTNLVGGLYRVDMSMSIPAVGYSIDMPSYTFNIALANDLELTSILYPVQNTKNKYPLNYRVPVTLSVRNVGFNPITSVTGNVKIYFGNETTPIYDETVTLNIGENDAPFTTNGSRELPFPQFMPNRGVGTYNVVATSTLNNATDLYLGNNEISRGNYAFDVAYDIELEAYNISNPASEISLGRPIVPVAELKNHGITDLSEPVNCRLVVKNLANNAIVYDRTEAVESILTLPSEIITNISFGENLVLNEAGQYECTLTVISSDDPIQANNTFVKTITVLPGMGGTYTIGSIANAPDADRNYPTIQSALEAIYLRGISSSIEFELTDMEYNVSGTTETPAIDLSGYIIGNDEEHTITFKPSDNIAMGGRAIEINMTAPNGIGVLMGQNNQPNYNNAPIQFVLDNRKKDFSNAGGYVTFDGGENQNLRFNLISNSNFRAAFYLGQGASHNTITNCEIIDLGTATDNCLIPNTRYNASLNQYEFQRNEAAPYSAAIAMRSIAPYHAKQYNALNLLVNPYNLDTLSNSYNTIANNVIDGFGYGVVSMGIGVLERNVDGNYSHVKYYNNNNTISGNTIKNIGKSGIFMGFEENSSINGNRIDNVTGNFAGSNSVYSSGIALGGEQADGYFGYNTMNIEVNANEISNVYSNEYAYGVSSYQCENHYMVSGTSDVVTLPDNDEETIITNNAIWNLMSSDDNTERYGVGVEADGISAAYRSRNDMIANNTIWIPADNYSNTLGATYGIYLNKVNSTKIFNNALMITETTYGENGHSALINYSGNRPSVDNVLINRNVYYYDAAQNNDVAFFEELDANGVKYPQTGVINEFKNLDQWQYWTGCDEHSYFYNFRDEIAINSNNKLRMKLDEDGQYPINSKLNNTGYIYDELYINNVELDEYLDNHDIDGGLRGIASARYDIGAFEFLGRVYIKDLEAVKITAPMTYKSATGEFAAHNYVMTTDPVNVKALIRNNGNMDANNVRVRATITRELPDGSWVPTDGSNNSEVYYTYVSVPAYNSVEADFNLGNPSVSPSFVPLTYTMLGDDYTVPAIYSEMKTNVTPRYNIDIEILDEADQAMGNNQIADDFRFFIKKSDLSILLSAENTTFDKTNTALLETLGEASYRDCIAGRLNYDSLKQGFNRLEWYQYVNAEPVVYHFDVLDRNVWEPRAVDYSMYRTLFWSDGDDKALARTQESDIRNFVANNTANYLKKNLVAASQEMVRENEAVRGEFISTYFKANNVAPGNPLGLGVSYADNRMKGVAISINKVETIVNTGFGIFDGVDEEGAPIAIFQDATCYPALMSASELGDGITVPAYYYMNYAGQDSIAGLATSALTRNVVYLGQDWRHFANLDTVLRGILDYNARNGSDIVPVELLDFDAIDRNKRVEISWSTLSEYNTDHFEIERKASGTDMFSTIFRTDAAGQSNTVKTYGPIVDSDVNYGNSYIYRLRTVDLDGASTLSNEVEVSLDNFFGVTPNPASSVATYSFNVGDNRNVNINLYDISGKLVKSLFNGGVSGNYTLDIDVTSLANGTYTIVLTDGDQTYTSNLHVRR